MSRDRRWPGEDLTYSQSHRELMHQLFSRGNHDVGHRTKMVDRDWTEYCHWCRTPLALIEEVRVLKSHEQAFADKPTTMTEITAQLAGIPAFLVGWQNERPDNVQDEIDRLNKRIRDLEAAYPIVSFRARWLSPRGPIVNLTPRQWWDWVYLLHRDHHGRCQRARRFEFPVRHDVMCDVFADHPLNAHRCIPLFGSLIQASRDAIA
jgi:hypothetical protein